MKRIVAIFVFVIIVSGCATFNQKDYEEGENVATTCPPDCDSGSKGIVTNILAPAEKATVFENERLYPSVYLEDAGQADADGIVCLTGLDDEVFDLYSSCTCTGNFDISINDEDAINFEGQKIEFESVLAKPEESIEQTLSVVTRYIYTTYGIIDICLTGDPGEDSDCKGYLTEGDHAATILKTSSSGPLTISKVSETLSKVGADAVTMRLEVTAKIDSDPAMQLITSEDVYSDGCSTLPESKGITAETSLIMDNRRYDCTNLVFEIGENEATTTCKVENIPTSDLIGGKVSKIKEDSWIEVNYAWEERQTVKFNVKVEE
jgi:hypothetical protein